MINVGKCAPKKQADLSHEWDLLAEERHRQISSGDDLSFEHVLVPTTLRLLQSADMSVVLDIGSGTGHFTARLARIAQKVIAVEPSSVSVSIARNICVEALNVHFVQAPIEEAVSLLQEKNATAAVAVMSLMTTPDLQNFAQALARLLGNGAKFVATMCHPWFWPRYWGYETEGWFSYRREIFIEAPFKISKCRTEFKTTHIHRPLEQYLTVFAEVGFRLDALVEPMPATKIEALYPKAWEFPRFLGIRWIKAI